MFEEFDTVVRQKEQALATQQAEQDAAAAEAEFETMARATQDEGLEIEVGEEELEKQKINLLVKVKQMWLLTMKSWFSTNFAVIQKAVQDAMEAWVVRQDMLAIYVGILEREGRN